MITISVLILETLLCCLSCKMRLCYIIFIDLYVMLSERLMDVWMCECMYESGKWYYRRSQRCEKMILVTYTEWYLLYQALFQTRRKNWNQQQNKNIFHFCHTKLTILKNILNHVPPKMDSQFKFHENPSSSPTFIVSKFISLFWNVTMV